MKVLVLIRVISGFKKSKIVNLKSKIVNRKS